MFLDSISQLFDVEGSTAKLRDWAYDSENSNKFLGALQNHYKIKTEIGLLKIYVYFLLFKKLIFEFLQQKSEDQGSNWNFDEDQLCSIFNYSIS